jgi:transcriptional regulator with XRE-family HTH domain
MIIDGLDPQPGDVVRQERHRAEWSQRTLADRSGVSEASVCRIERGDRQPSLPLLGALLGALGRQLRLTTEPLWQDIDASIDSRETQSVSEIFEERKDMLPVGGFDLLRIEQSLAEIDHCYCGLTAAALLGAPVPVTDCEILIHDGDATIDALDRWLYLHEAQRWSDRLQRWWFDDVDPRAPGPMRWSTDVGVVRVRTTGLLPPVATVSFEGTALPVVGLAHIETDDPHTKRVLERMRSRLASNP